jgi:integrase
MATFRAVVLAHHRKEDGTYNVKIRVTHNRVTKYMKTNIFVSKGDLTKGMKIKSESLNYEIEGIIREYRQECNLWGSRIDSMTAGQIIERLQRGRGAFRLDFIQFGRDRIERLRKEGRTGTARTYGTAINALVKYIRRDTLDISEITGSFLRKFVEWIDGRPSESKKPKGERAHSMYVSAVRTMHNAAKEEYNDEDLGIINIPQSPFAKFKVPPVPVTRKRALPVDVIQKIIDLPYRKTGIRFNLAKDCFLISFALAGMNSADMFSCTKLKGGIITYNRQKTATRRQDKAEMKIRIEDCVLPLIDKYRDAGREKLFNFHLHYSNAGGLNEAVNIGLKQIGKALEIDDLEFYAARHSWATIASSSAVGIDKYTVHEALNHSDRQMKITDIYIERDWSVIWNANKKVLDLFKWDFFEVVKSSDYF